MGVLTSTLTKVRTTGARIVAEYENGQEERPIGGYVRAMATYGSLVTGLTLAGRARGVRLPERVPYDDLALLTVATFRGSRLLAKSAVASPLRAPFTEFAGPGGPGEARTAWLDRVPAVVTRLRHSCHGACRGARHVP